MASKDLSVAKKGKKLTIFSIWDALQPKTQFRAWEHIKGTFGEDYVTRGTSEVYYSKWKKSNKDNNDEQT